MTIEKLELLKPCIALMTEQEKYEFSVKVFYKLNELIDFINTREQDRSDQMARIVDKLHKLEIWEKANTVVFQKHSGRLDKLESSNKLNEKIIEAMGIINAHNSLTEKSDSEELLPCAWCNIDATLCEFVKGPGYSVFCSNLIDCPVRAETKLYKTKQEAISAWNTRVK